jgi:nucleoside-triphosphatase THEP1
MKNDKDNKEKIRVVIMGSPGVGKSTVKLKPKLLDDNSIN